MVPFLPPALIAAAMLLAPEGIAPPADGAGATAITLAVSKPEIWITSGFHGDLLGVGGTAPERCDVLLLLSSAPSPETLDLKGKRGLLWLSVAKVRFKGAPRLCLIRSTRPVGELLSPGEQAKEHIGWHGLKASLRVSPGRDADLFASEFLRLKRDEGLYDWAGGGVTRGRGGTYRAEFPWPTRGPSGTYRIDAFAVIRGEVVGSTSEAVVVKKVGVEEWVSRLAADHGLLYGLLTTVLAALAGLAANALFEVVGRAGKKAPSPEE